MKYLLLAILLVSFRANALLGDTEDTGFQAKALRAKGETVINRKSFQIKMRRDEGLETRRFVDSTGFVFAISWRGVNEPELSTFLNPDQMSELQSVRRSQRQMRNYHRGPQKFESSRMIYLMSGHPRDWRGLVYLKDRLPGNVTPEDL